ncbi:MAG: hypothetical protein AB7O68_16725 [Pirellulales bacterium]
MRLIENPDFYFVAFCLLAWWAGSALAGARDWPVRRSRMVTVVGMVVVGLYELDRIRPVDGEGLCNWAVTVLMAGLLFVGCSRVVLSLFDHARAMRTWRAPSKPSRALTPVYVPPPKAEQPPKVEPVEKKPFRRRFRDMVASEKDRFDDRCEAIEELRDLDYLPEELIKEMATDELQQFIRRVSDGLKADQAD